MTDLIRRYFPELNEEQYRKFEKMQDIYKLWNSRINVVSRKDIDNLEVNHILHSLSIAKIISFQDGTEICDVGTGGGFPGIPLAVMFPDVRFTLVDSIGKKINVVQAVSDELGLENIVALHSRAENLDKKFDFIVSRAVTRLPQFISWVEKLVSKRSSNTLNNGIIYLKGGDFQDEISEIKRKAIVINISDFFQEGFFETKKIIHIGI